MLAGLLFGCLLQIDAANPFDATARMAAASARANEIQHRNASDQERRDFEEKFNKLLDALQGFSQEYNKSRGSVWPAKKVEAVNRALRELMQTKSWRGKAEKPDPSINVDPTSGDRSKSGEPLQRP